MISSLLTEDLVYIDTHAHFDSCIIDANFSEESLFASMKENSVCYAVHIATEIPSMRWAEDFSAKHSNVFFAAGVHPSSQFYDSDAEEFKNEIEVIKRSGLDNKFIGIGEVGLDYYHLPNTREIQIKYFEWQIETALQYNKPLIIHTRDAFDDTYDILKNSGAERVLIHCFSGGGAEAEKMLDLGYYLSFAGNVTFKKAGNLREALKVTPFDRLFFETDCPYLSPEPVRGSRNQPANVKYVYQFASDFLSADEDIITSSCRKNFEKLFGVSLTDMGVNE